MNGPAAQNKTRRRATAHRLCRSCSTAIALLVLGFAVTSETFSQPPEMVPAGQTQPPGHRFTRPPAIPPPVRGTSAADRRIDTSGGQSISLQALLDIASANNPTLRQARAQIGAAMGTAIQAGLYPNPELAYVADQIGVEGTVGEFQGAILRQEVVTGGKLKTSRAKYLQRVEAVEALAVAQQYRVSNDIQMQFYKTLGDAELLSIHRELAKSAENSSVTVRELYNVGQANRADVLRSNVKLQRARLDVLSKENEYLQAYRRLTSLVGVELPMRPLDGKLAGKIETIDFDSTLANIWQNSPQIIAANAKLRGDRATVERERVEPIPNLLLEGGVGYDFETRETVASASVGVRLPLWNHNQGTIQQAQADAVRQEAEITRLKMVLRLELAKTYQIYLTSLQHIEQYQQVVLPDARETYRVLLESYQQNRIAWPEVLEAQREYFETRIEYVHQLVQWRTSEVMIQGMLLQGGLMAAEGATPPSHIDSSANPR